MFKTKEELEKKYSHSDNNKHIVIDACFKNFAERLEIYKKYKAGDETIPNWLWDKFAQRYPTIHDKLHKWEDWLFDYCFGDIIRS